MYAQTILRHLEATGRKPSGGQVQIVQQQIERIRKCYAPDQAPAADDLERRLLKIAIRTRSQ